MENKEIDKLKKELEQKKRELEIEASLERVRAISMGMKKPADMVKVCKVISNQLQFLGIENIRNVQTLILKEKKGIYLNYEYFAAYKKGIIEEEDYNKHPTVHGIAMAMKKSAGTFFGGTMEKDELNVYRKYRKQVNLFPDPLLDKAIKPQYNFYSIGLGGLGLTTYEPLPPDGLEIFKRFHKVFSLAYNKFKDIEQAEVQALEAQIEVALERVRSKSMAMNHTSELQEVIITVHQQFKHLGIADSGGSFIAINDEIDDGGNLCCWGAGGMVDYLQQIQIPLLDRPIMANLVQKIKKGPGFFTEEFSYEDKMEFFTHMFKFSPLNSSSPEHKKEVFSREGGYTRSCIVSKYTSIFIINHHGKKFSDEDNEILKRFGKVFEQTYTRFLDLQKAEEQARESEIQLALERVRARTMAMHNSDELGEVASVLFKQIGSLTATPDRFNIAIANDEDKSLDVWITDQDGHKITQQFIAKTSSSPFVAELFQGWKKQDDHAIIDLYGKKLENWIRYMGGELGMPFKKNSVKDHRFISSVYFSHGFIGVTTNKEPDSETIHLLERFSKVFQQTYVRFLDLKKAEAQARESEIQLALERVRARTMAMQKSDELAETAQVLYQQFRELGENPEQLSIATFNETEKVLELWLSIRGNRIERMFRAPLDEPIVTNKIYSAWKKGNKSAVIDISGDELKKYDNFRKHLAEYNDENFVSKEKHRRVVHCAFFPKGFLSLAAPEPQPDETMNLLERFASVFDLTFTRFLDLQKAEAQAREAQIEAALERVRSRTMGMQHSDELNDLIAIVFKELTQLDLILTRGIFMIWEPDQKAVRWWMANSETPSKPMNFLIPNHSHPTQKEYVKAWKRREARWTYELQGKLKHDWDDYLFSETALSMLPLPVIEGMKAPDKVILTASFSAFGCLSVASLEPLSENHIKLIMRFTKVFDQTFTRFLDLKKAEAQAREAQIEAALERVRSLALGMRKSEEVGNVTDSFFEEFNKLTVKIISCSIIIADEKNDSVEIWRARSGIAIRPFNKSSLSATLNVIKENIPEWYSDYLKAMGSKKGYLQDVLTGDKRSRFLNTNMQQIGLTSGEREKYMKMLPAQIFTSFLFFKLGYLALISEKKLPEENLTIARRFVDVFDFAYTRFLDLQRAEAQAREAVKQASLDRVRGEIASMRTSEDLNRITPVIWRELQALEVPFIRCGVFIVEEEKQKVQVYLTTPDGKPLGALNLSFDANKLTSNSIKDWRKKRVYKEHWNKEEFIAWTKSMMKLGQVQNAETYQGTPDAPESLNLHFIPFKQGMLYVGDTSPLTDEKLELVKTLAEAFSIAYARYEDFKNLEEAKNKVESTLNELKAAQTQLVQAEKMASLGELTAGIAHEIQNPLNFVNNFSEVSTELLEEMKEEIENGDLEEVKAITKDVIQNLEKILHHGKRADGIVKGMLQHSRGSSGEKVLTDINALADEYLRLSYHGLRAKDKSFNADFKLEADEKLPKINVVSQDIGRVLLNLINNAFYAVSEKVHQKQNGYKPSVIVSTRILGDKIEISVKDNGSGIPKSVQEKIFQPFFTTKPTGQGTGLGLSLSYDIIKTHGGKLTVESSEGEGTTFTIQLPKTESV